MRYKHVLFDFDGVLCDSLSEAMSAFNLVRESRFPAVPTVRFQRDMETVYAGSLRTCLLPWLKEDESREFFDLHSAEMVRRAGALRPYPGVGDLLRSLMPHCSIVTSAYSDAVRQILTADGLLESGAIRIAGRELRETKTKKIRSILAAQALLPAEAVYVGDLESDMLYCRDVPIDFIGAGYGYHSASYLRAKGATTVVDTIEELARVLHGDWPTLERAEA